MTEVGPKRMSIGDQRQAHVASPRSRWASPRMALVLGALTVLLFAVSAALAVLARDSSSLLTESLLLPFTAVGVVIAYRQPRNPIGWIMLATAIVLMLGGSAGLYGVLVFREGHHDLPLGRLAVFLSPGWIAILLLPLPILLFPDARGRVQRIVDRRFNRARYDAEQTVAAFAARLRDAVDLDTVQSELLDTVERCVEPSHASVWIRPVNSR